MKILLTDDMVSMRHILLHMLRNLGYTDIDEAVDGDQAFTMLHQKQYDLLITDLYMPKLNGKQLLNQIRNDPKLSQLPVLMVTCEDEKATIEEIIASKVTGFIIKPFNIRTLKKHLHWINHPGPNSIPIEC